jgi:two-component system NarL family response regulator
MSAPVSRIRVMFVDDHHMLRAGLAATLAAESDMEVVAEAERGEEAVGLYRQHRPDIVLMDLRLPGMSGIEAILRIRSEFSDARVIVLTTYDVEEEMHRAIQAGARAYLLKDLLRKELVHAIRAVHRGQRYLPASVAQRLANSLPRPNLSARELELLGLVVKGMSNREIAQAASLSEGTVRIHLSNIFSKLGVSDRTQAAVAALQRGLVHLD